MAEKKTLPKKTPKKIVGQKKQPQKPFKRVEVKINLNKFFNRGFIYLIIGLLFVPFLIQLFGSGAKDQITISQLVRDIREEKIEKLEVAGQQLRAQYKEGDQVKIARKEEGQYALEVLSASGIDLAEVDLEIENLSFGDMLWELILSLLPILLMVAFFFFIFRQARGAQDGLMGFGQSKAKVFVKGKQDVNFNAVGGMDEAKAELEEIVDFLKNPKKYQQVGARTPKGVLLVGPAGTGKTLLARAVAGEAKVQFLSIAGSEFMEMLVGVGASRARDLFNTAKKMAPSIIFIDEIDAIGRQRSRGSVGGNDEREQTLNQILVEMDGFTPNDNVMVMAATNRGDLLDPALVRPGRFDRRVIVRLPDLKERQHIIKIHAKGKPFVKDLRWDRVAKRTVGFSGADLENMLNEAAIAVARDIRKEIKYTDIEEASLKVKLGRTKKRLHDEYERKLTAYHEAGHAVLAHIYPHTDPVHRVSIVSRGMALGYTLTPPEKDKVQVTRSELVENMAVMLGGRAAEDLIFKELTAGASNDIKRATQIARSMVVEYGMSDLGPMNFGPQYESNDYGALWGKPYEISDNVQSKVDTHIGELINTAQSQAIKSLKKYQKQLDAVAMKLLEVETLDADEFSELMGMEKAKPDILK
jgi:cell division protease FtsH